MKLSVDDCDRKKFFSVLALSLSVVASVLFGVSKSGRLSLFDFFRSFFIDDHRFEPFCLPQISSNEDAKSFLALRINAVTRFRCARYFIEFSSVGCIFDKWNSRLFSLHSASSESESQGCLCEMCLIFLQGICFSAELRNRVCHLVHCSSMFIGAIAEAQSWFRRSWRNAGMSAFF